MKTPVRKNVHIISLGCPKNLIDSEVMAGLLNQEGMRLVERRELADIVIVNTCAFINLAKEEAIEEILNLAEEKKQGRSFRLVVAGCLAQRYGNELLASIPEVDLFIGTGEVGNIVRHIKKLDEPRLKKTAVITKPNFLMTSQLPRLLPKNAKTAYLKISDGCSNCCTYCAIPAIRGKARSRRPEDILEEATTLAAKGIREIIITGQDTTAYGRDLKNSPQLSTLLDNLAKIRGIRWIRLLYAHPAHLATDILQSIAANNKICRYLDLPIQHINDDILKAMNRQVTSGQIKKIIAQARQIMPDLALRTSIIVGFPGETVKRFEQLLDFINETKFTHMGVFTYSREDGTSAAALASRVSEREKERRREMIMTEQAMISRELNRQLIGTIREIIIEEQSDRPDFDYMGRCRCQSPEIDGITYLKVKNIPIGSIIKCRIIEADDYDLFAETL